ncbi:MAG: hypothetical protein PHP42_03390 [Bacteroidota bacterium]|nr:hypothetical protein [Bacteroidota bacterium]
MDNYEEYLLRVLKRTHSGLQDSLIPAHGIKVSKLLDKFERTSSIENEIQTLMRVQGFAKCALTMQWLLDRTKREEETFSPEQFESDILLLNEKLFEAFLNQPFDMPDYSKSANIEPPQRPIQQNIQMANEEFFIAGSSGNDTSAQGSASPLTPKISEPDWGLSTPASEAFQSDLVTSSAGAGEKTDVNISLDDVMGTDLIDATRRISQNAIDFSMEMPGGRAVAMAVMRVSVKAALESAKMTNNILIQDFYQALLSVINYADQQGKIRSDDFADIIRDVGDRLAIALKDSGNGVTILKTLTEFIHEPKELFKKR